MTRVFAPVPTARAAAETPPDRDRVVDGARAAAIALLLVSGLALRWAGGERR